ncbi:MAG: metal-sensing transcriptional repressor [Clostridia bacterium]|nr:metal-sensing transcriptional repressor [Clostridia bacterium]
MEHQSETAIGEHSEHLHTHAHTKEVRNRLSRAIGHLESVRKMVEDGRDCSEILVQLAAVRAALGAVSRVILKDHLEHCIVHAVESNDQAAIDELEHAIDKLIR